MPLPCWNTDNYSQLLCLRFTLGSCLSHTPSIRKPAVVNDINRSLITLCDILSLNRPILASILAQ